MPLILNRNGAKKNVTYIIKMYLKLDKSMVNTTSVSTL